MPLVETGGNGPMGVAFKWGVRPSIVVLHVYGGDLPGWI